MDNRIRELLASLGIGLVVGASGAIIFERVFSRTSRELSKLSDLVVEIRDELDRLKSVLSESTDSGSLRPKVRKAGSYYSIHPSSGDEDDDEFEEAYEVFTTAPESLLYKDAPEYLEAKIDDEELTAHLKEVDKLFKGSEDEVVSAYDLLIRNREKYSGNAQFLWRLAKSHMLYSSIKSKRGETEEQKKLLYEGSEVAKKALTYDNKSADAHKWFALLIGSLADFETTAQKIANGFLFKEHILKAIELRPTEAYLYNFYGRWCYEVAMLSWWEKRAAQAIYGSLPESTIDEALSNFLKAEEIDPGFYNANALMIAKCYIQKREYTKVAGWLDKAISIGGETADELKARTEATLLLPQYR
ncbi:regulator of microtubule dynamics protein 3-like [Anneissia japonica]|uniref:regulator of microtubule dynamics protein 3-like n=1 Tax=Anneissia japonica TaxID=1529436 RepID=UPI00142585FA|nr:regulator of microtubule dynamics protein 3-like [Anneissia japonica]